MTTNQTISFRPTDADMEHITAITEYYQRQDPRYTRTDAISAALAEKAKQIQKESGAMKLHEVRALFEKVREHLLDLGYSWAEAESAVDMCANADDLERSNLKWLAQASRAQVDEMIALHEAEQ